MHDVANPVVVSDNIVLTPSQDNVSPLSQSPRFNQSSSLNRQTQRLLLKKHARSLEQTNTSDPKLRHSTSLEKFPGNRSWLKPSLSLGNIQMYKSLRQGSLSGTVFSSTESLTEEPEPIEPNYGAFNHGKKQFKLASYKKSSLIHVDNRLLSNHNYLLEENIQNLRQPDSIQPRKYPINRQTSLGSLKPFENTGSQIERLGSPKLLNKSYSTEKFPIASISSENRTDFGQHEFVSQRTNPLRRQASLGVMKTYSEIGEQTEILESPKLLHKSYSTERFPSPSSTMRQDPMERIMERGHKVAQKGRHEYLTQKRNIIQRQGSLGMMKPHSDIGGQIERLGSPKILSKSYSMERFPNLPTSILQNPIGTVLQPGQPNIEEEQGEFVAQRKNLLRRQTSLGAMKPCSEFGGQIEKLRSPKLLHKSYSTDRIPGSPLSNRQNQMARIEEVTGSSAVRKHRLQNKGGLSLLRSSQSLLIEEPNVSKLDGNGSPGILWP